MFETTEDFQCAKLWAEDILSGRNVAKYYLSHENFVAAYKSDKGFSFIVKGERFYAHLYGDNAYLDQRSNSVAVDSDLNFEDEHFEMRGGGFEIWELDTANSHAPIELLNDYEEINAMIENHAPDSSVSPGDNEEIFWGGIRDAQGELIACAVVVKWQSGFHIMASVVTRTNERGRGFGTALSKGIASHAREIGIPLLGLGVSRSNIVAQKVYKKAGYKRIGSFTNYSRV
jgi:ribosomal protein S18 acetylase RimI-like enzyme